ncbi:MAG: oxygen-independent coproporphyrinogen III oxidase [bacterium]
MPSAAAAALPIVEPRQLDLYDVPGPRYTSYPTAPEWSDTFTPADYAAALRTARLTEAPLSLYVHIPFCWSMCRYCGCNVVVTRDPGRADAYLDVVEQEVALVAAQLGRRREVAQLHFGGGTPTFLDERQFARLYGAITRHFTLAAGAESTVEINPVVTSRSQISALRALGVDRLSMGVQDFDPLVQETIGRRQSPDETRALVNYVRGLGFESVNFDLIYGLPHQTPTRWQKTLETVIDIAPDRLAVYSFAYVPGFAPHQRRLPADALPLGIDKLELFRQAWGAFVEAGYVPVGMDHFAAPGDRLARAAHDGTLGRNFQGYTVRRAPETVAFGASAISDIGGVFAQNHRRLSHYREAVEAGRLPVGRGIALTAEDERRRAVITELMCNLRVDLGPGASDAYRVELAELAPLAADGLVVVTPSAEGRVSVAVTGKGRMFLRNVAMPFDARLRARGADRPGYSRTV